MNDLMSFIAYKGLILDLIYQYIWNLYQRSIIGSVISKSAYESWKHFAVDPDHADRDIIHVEKK